MRKLTCFFLISLIVFSAYGYQQKWKGTIEYEDGVKVIINPKKPLYGDIVFDLEQDLSIGREDDDNYIFFRVRGIEVDKDENIYVVDYGNYRIQKFDKSGNYIQSFGRWGQGPGEFQHNLRLDIDEQSGNLHISDGVHLIKIFDRNGNYLEQILLEKPIVGFNLDGKGNYLAIWETMSNVKLSKTFCKIDGNGKMIKNYAEYPYHILFRQTGENTSASGNYPYAYDLFMSKIKANKYIYGYSENYELNVVDQDGQIQYKIKKIESPKGFSAEEKRLQQSTKLKYKSFEIPAHKPFFYSIFSDSEGRIYIQKNRTHGFDFEINREVDIFSKDGYFMYRSVLPRGTYLIKDGFLYDYFMNEDTGAEMVRRFKIKNWDQIKEGIK